MQWSWQCWWAACAWDPASTLRICQWPSCVSTPASISGIWHHDSAPFRKLPSYASACYDGRHVLASTIWVGCAEHAQGCSGQTAPLRLGQGPRQLTAEAAAMTGTAVTFGIEWVPTRRRGSFCKPSNRHNHANKQKRTTGLLGLVVLPPASTCFRPLARGPQAPLPRGLR